MRVNVYAEEITDRVEIVEKDGFTGVRFYLELPVNINPGIPGSPTMRGPFIHKPGDDDSSAVTFWGKGDIGYAFQKALDLLHLHHEETKKENHLI